MKLRNFIELQDVIDPVSIERVKEKRPPAKIFGCTVPSDLNDISLGQLLELSTCESETDALVACFRVVLDERISDRDIMGLEAVKALSFVFWVQSEVSRINKLFESIEPVLSKEESEAAPPSFGVPGLLDYAMKRFNLHSYDDALHVKALECWQAMKIDNENTAYSKRLQAIYQSKHKTK